MSYTYSITSKGQITIPIEFRKKLGLDKAGKATFFINDRGEVTLAAPANLTEVRKLLSAPTFADKPSKTEQAIGDQLAKKYDVR